MLKVGAGVWVPCEVKPGPFDHERRVRINVEGNNWFGFVNTRWLESKVEEGNDRILVTVVSIDQGNVFKAVVPGSAPVRSQFEGKIQNVEAIGSDSVKEAHTA